MNSFQLGYDLFLFVVFLLSFFGAIKYRCPDDFQSPDNGNGCLYAIFGTISSFSLLILVVRLLDFSKYHS